jgi:hypothetical protein
MGRFLPPDHSQGDERTIGGYRAVHARPAAFEGADGASYSVELEVDETGERDTPYGAYFLFVRWGRGDPTISGHLETDYLARARTPDEALAALGAMSLEDVKRVLDGLIRERTAGPSSGGTSRPWWEVMRDDGDE